MTIHIILAAGVLACLAFTAFLWKRTQKTMTALEDLKASMTHLEEASEKLTAVVNDQPARMAKMLSDYIAANPPVDGEPAIDEAALLEISRQVREHARTIDAQASVSQLYFDNQEAHGDPRGGA